VTTLGAVADVVRSKNASPFRVTLDVFFSDPAAYEILKQSAILTPETIAGIYDVELGQVEGIYFVDQARGVKVTIRKTYPSDHFHSTDCYGAQQHLPLSNLEIPEFAGLAARMEPE
jgi:hypothetical protein